MTASTPPSGKAGVAEVLDADVVRGVEGPGDSPRERVELDADEVHPRRGEPRKFPMPHPGSSTVASAGTPRRVRASCIACMTTGEV